MFAGLVLLPLIVSVSCAATLIGIGITKRSVGGIGFGAVFLSALVPLTLVDGHGDAVTVGNVLVACQVLAWLVMCAIVRGKSEILLGFVGVVAFWAHVFFLSNAP